MFIFVTTYVDCAEVPHEPWQGEVEKDDPFFVFNLEDLEDEEDTELDRGTI